jgi:S1-C subfamily serine protease
MTSQLKKVAYATATGAFLLMSGGDLKAGGSGTGFLVSATGYIVTNSHVATGSYRFKDGREIPLECSYISAQIGHKTYEAKLLAKDQHNDLALLKIDLSERKLKHLASANTRQKNQGWISLGGRMAPGRTVGLRRANSQSKNFGYIQFAKNSASHGDIVHVFGFPIGNYISSQMKIATGAINATMGIGNSSSRFQHDAAAYPGNSGSPVLDKAGNLVGVHVAGWGRNTRLKFAIKGSVVKEFLKLNDVPFQELQSDTVVTAQSLYQQAKQYIVFMTCYDYQ